VDPIDHLLEEHREIMARVVEVRAAMLQLAEAGAAALNECLPVLRRFGEMMATTLELHARKEDEALFPAVEAVFGTGFGPTQVMRGEHQTIRAQGELLHKTLHELRTVEHPALEAKREALLSLLGSGPAEAVALPGMAREIIELLDSHFAKEEQILFPLARQALDPPTMAFVAAAMQEIGLTGLATSS